MKGVCRLVCFFFHTDLELTEVLLKPKPPKFSGSAVVKLNDPAVVFYNGVFSHPTSHSHVIRQAFAINLRL